MTVVLLISFGLIWVNLYKNPNIVFVIWGFLYCLSVFSTQFDFEVMLTLGSFNIFPNDLISLFFSIVIAKRANLIIYKFNKYTSIKIMVFVLGLNFIVFFAELLFGSYTLQEIYNRSRGFIEIPIIFLYYISFDYEEEDFIQFSTYLKNMSLAICIFFWIVTILMLSGKVPSAHDEHTDRAVGTYISFFACISTLFLYVKYVSKRADRREIILMSFFTLSLLFMRNRSIWIGFSAGIITVLLNYTSQISKVLSIAAASVVVLLVLSFAFPSVSGKMMDKFLESSEVLTETESFSKSTGAFRMARWKSRLENNFDWRVLLFGQGHGYKRTSYISFNGRKGDNSTSFHNQYLEQSFRIGLISVLLLIGTMISLIRVNSKFLRKDMAVSLNAAYVCTLVYGMAYNFQLMFYILLAINLSILVSISYSALIKKNENSSSDSNVQQTSGIKRLVLDAWKHDRS